MTSIEEVEELEEMPNDGNIWTSDNNLPEAWKGYTFCLDSNVSTCTRGPSSG